MGAWNLIESCQSTKINIISLYKFQKMQYCLILSGDSANTSVIYAFENPDALRQILISHNAHYILAGKSPPGRHDNVSETAGSVKIGDHDPVHCMNEVHYIQDYDEELGRALAVGSDIAINVPIIGLNAVRHGRKILPI